MSNTIWRNIAGTSFTQIYSTFFSFASSIFLTRILGAEGRGEWTLFNTSLSLFALVLGFGLNSAVIYFVSGEKIDVSKLLTTLLLSVLLSMLFSIACIGVFQYLGFAHLLFPDNYNSILYQCSFLFLLGHQLFVQLMMALFNAKKIFKEVNYYVVFGATLNLLIYVYYYFVMGSQKSGFDFILITTILLSIIMDVFYVYLFVRRIGVWPSKKVLNLDSIKQIFVYGGVIYCTNVLQFFSYRMDFWFIDYYFKEKVLGVYSLGVTLVQLLWLLPITFSGVLYTYVSSMNREESLNLTILVAKISLWSSIVLGIIGYVLSIYLLPVLYGNDFKDSVNVIGWLLFGVIPFSVTTILGAYNAGNGKIYVNLYGVLMGFAVCVLLDILLIEKYGLMGACFATVASYIINTLYVIYEFIYNNNYNIKDLLLLKKKDMLIFQNIFAKK